MQATDFLVSRTPELRVLDAGEIEAVSGGLDDSFFKGYAVGVAAMVVGQALVYGAGRLWDWLFD